MGTDPTIRTSAIPSPNEAIDVPQTPDASSSIGDHMEQTAARDQFVNASEDHPSNTETFLANYPLAVAALIEAGFTDNQTHSLLRAASDVSQQMAVVRLVASLFNSDINARQMFDLEFTVDLERTIPELIRVLSYEPQWDADQKHSMLMELSQTLHGLGLSVVPNAELMMNLLWKFGEDPGQKRELFMHYVKRGIYLESDEFPLEFFFDLSENHPHALQTIYEWDLAMAKVGFNSDVLYLNILPVLHERIAPDVWSNQASVKAFFSATHRQELITKVETYLDFNVLQAAICRHRYHTSPRAIQAVLANNDTLEKELEKATALPPHVTTPQALREHMAQWLRDLEADDPHWRRIDANQLSDGLLKESDFAVNTIDYFARKHPRVVPRDLRYDNEIAFVRALWSAMTDYKFFMDSNVTFIFEKLGIYPDMAAYYRAEQKVVLDEMHRAGFDVDSVLDGSEVLRRNMSVLDQNAQSDAPWPERLKSLAIALIGGKDEPPKKLYSFNKTPKDRRNLLAKANGQDGAYLTAIRGNQKAARQVIDRLISVVEEAFAKSEDRDLEELHELLSGLKNELAGGARLNHTGYVFTARRSRKRVPEILFHNQRLACCIFKPEGFHNGEISQIVLDPKTPLLEFWIEGHNEFLAIATQYLGTNEKQRPAMFVDTFELNQRFYSRGRSAGLKFAIDAIVADAIGIGAEEIVIHRAQYGRPMEFSNFVKDLSRQGKFRESIRQEEAYLFTTIDEDDRALAGTRGLKYHYTDAFRHYSRIKGPVNALVVDIKKYPLPEGQPLKKQMNHVSPSGIKKITSAKPAWARHASVLWKG